MNKGIILSNKDYIKENFKRKQNLKYEILFNKIKYDLWILNYDNPNILELDIVIKAKSIIKDYINNWILGLYYNLNPWKNYWLWLTTSKEKYYKVWNSFFEIKRSI